MNLGSYFSSLRFATVMAMVILHLSSLRSYVTCPCKFCPGAALMRETKNLFPGCFRVCLHPLFGPFVFPQCSARQCNGQCNEPTLLAFSFLICFFVIPLSQRSNIPCCTNVDLCLQTSRLARMPSTYLRSPCVVAPFSIFGFAQPYFFCPSSVLVSFFPVLEWRKNRLTSKMMFSICKIYESSKASTAPRFRFCQGFGVNPRCKAICKRKGSKRVVLIHGSQYFALIRTIFVAYNVKRNGIWLPIQFHDGILMGYYILLEFDPKFLIK